MAMQMDRVLRVNAKIWRTQNTVIIIILFILMFRIGYILRVSFIIHLLYGSCILLLLGSVFKHSLMNSKNNFHKQLPGSEEMHRILQKLPKNDHFTDVEENTCDIDLDALMDLENILFARSPYVKAAVSAIRKVLETHPALQEKDVGIEEDLAK